MAQVHLSPIAGNRRVHGSQEASRAPQRSLHDELLRRPLPQGARAQSHTAASPPRQPSMRIAPSALRRKAVSASPPRHKPLYPQYARFPVYSFL
eukprot:5422550-Pleurochrysis_carterae.AAC.1